MDEHNRPSSPILTWMKGFGMGAADIVPGFSGGTVALLTGIYQRLVTAISRFDWELFRLLKSRDWRGATRHVDFGFLLTLGIGLACGFLVSMLTIHRLLKWPVTSPYVLAAFIGLILGSSHFVLESIRRIKRLHVGDWLLVAVGAAAAAEVSLLTARLVEEPPLWFIFLAATIAICAMILPGISGAMMLMVLGVYQYLLGIGHKVIHREELGHSLLVCLVFLLGCVVGLLAFSKLLRWLFATRPAPTLCLMFGLMLGSVVRLWPYQAVGEQIPDPSAIGLVVVAVLAAAVLIVVTRYAGQSRRSKG